MKHRLFILLINLLFTAANVFAASGIVWSAYEYIGDGAGGGKYSNKYKISAAERMEVVNIQRPIFAEEDGIYCTFPAGISEISCKGAIQGAGAVLYLSSFTDQETEVIVKHGLGETKFWVWYEDGTPSSEEKETIKPVMKSAELLYVTFNMATVKVEATDKQTEDGEEMPVTTFQVTYGENTKVFNATDGQIVINNLSAGTEYEFDIYAVDAVGNISENTIKVSATTDALTYCDFATGHLGNANFGDPEGRILLTISNPSGNIIRVTVKPNKGNGATKNLDYLRVYAPGSEKEGFVYEAGAQSADAADAKESLSVDITYANMPERIDLFEIQWSQPAWDGTWSTNITSLTPVSFCTNVAPDTPDETIEITTARLDNISLQNGEVVLQLEARKGESKTPVYNFLVEDTDTDFSRQFSTSLGNNMVSLTGFTPCVNYRWLTVTAIDGSNRSEPVLVDLGEGVSFPVAEGLNLALGKPAYAAKSVGGYEIHYANDGDVSTRWAGGEVPADLRGNYDNEWWYVDLQGYYQLSRIEIFWEGAYSTDFVLQGAKELPADVGNDGLWTTFRTCSGIPNVGNMEENKNVYDLSGTDAQARYVRIKSYANSLENQWGMSIYEFRVFGSCATEDDETKPVVTQANLIGVTNKGIVTLQLQAQKGENDATPVYEFLVQDETNRFAQRVTTSSGDNMVSLTGFTPCTDYHLTVTAINGYTHSNPYPAEIDVSIVGNLALGKTCSAGFTEGNNVAGNAVDADHGTRWSGYNAPDGQCWWQVDLGRTYKINTVAILFENNMITDYTIAVSADGEEWKSVVKRDEAPQTGTEMQYTFPDTLAHYVRISSSVQRYMSFYEFEVYGSCEEVSESGHCIFSGGPGDGLQDEAVRYEFTQGYRLDISLKENDKKDTIVVIRSQYFDDDEVAVVAVIHRFLGSEVKLSEEVYILNKGVGTDNPSKHTYYTTGNLENITIEIPLDTFRNVFKRHMVEYPYSICITVKYDVKDKPDMKCTNLDYFMLDGSCAERSFYIYHHDNMPEEPEHGALSQFEGGVIMRPIQYKRKFKPGLWETLYLPFELTKVTVYDPTDDEEYDLYAQYTDDGGNTQEGNFWLRTFGKDKEMQAVMADAFQDNWQDVRASKKTEALPKKGIPYIMMMPDVDGYYNDKYIVFHGKGSQKIDKKYEAPSLPQDDYFSYSGNNTMMPWGLKSAYVLDDKGAYFVSSPSGVTLHPFECTVNATQATIRRLPRLGLNVQTDVTTGNALPTTRLSGEVYGLMGHCLGTFDSLDTYEALVARLPSGIYIVRTDRGTTKIYVEGAL